MYNENVISKIFTGINCLFIFLFIFGIIALLMPSISFIYASNPEPLFTHLQGLNDFDVICKAVEHKIFATKCLYILSTWIIMGWFIPRTLVRNNFLRYFGGIFAIFCSISIFNGFVYEIVCIPAELIVFYVGTVLLGNFLISILRGKMRIWGLPGFKKIFGMNFNNMQEAWNEKAERASEQHRIEEEKWKQQCQEERQKIKEQQEEEKRRKKIITYALQYKNTVNAYNSDNQCILTKIGTLQGCSGGTVSVLHNNFIYVYDGNGRTISTRHI